MTNQNPTKTQANKAPSTTQKPTSTHITNFKKPHDSYTKLKPIRLPNNPKEWGERSLLKGRFSWGAGVSCFRP